MIVKAIQGDDGYTVPKSIKFIDLVIMLERGELERVGFGEHGAILVRFTNTTPEHIKAVIAGTASDHGD